MDDDIAFNFKEGDRVQRISSPHIKGEVDYERPDGFILVTWDEYGRWPIDPNDLRLIWPPLKRN